jgi:LysM repeat protein
MDTISRENNSMLPVGGIIVGAIALLISIFGAVQASKANKAIAEHQPKIDKIDGIESQAASAAASAEKTSRDLAARVREIQDNFNLVGTKLTEYGAAIVKIEEAQKKPVATGGKKGGEPVVAGPGEYVIKSGDTFSKIAAAQGTTASAITAVNPGVDSSKLHVGQKIKLPKK